MVTSLSRLLSQRECIDVLNVNVTKPIKATGARLIVVPPKPPPKLDFGGIGTAYDYWFRSQLVPSTKKAIESLLGHEICMQRYGGDESIRTLLQRHVSAFLKSPHDNRAVFAACLFLAKFEAEYRSGVTVASLAIARHNVDELARIAKATDFSYFAEAERLLNPGFCVEGSKLRITADGDVIVGKTLIDLKTSSKLDLKDNLRQLVAYLALNELGRYEREIEAVGVYYPRFRYFLQLPKADLVSSDQFGRIKQWFANQLGNRIRACGSPPSASSL